MKSTKRILGLAGLTLVWMALAGAHSARAEGTGGYDSPYFQADFVQELSEWSSSLINPALLYRVNQFHLSGGFYRWGLGSEALGFQNFSFLVPVRRNQTLGLTMLFTNATIQETDENGVELGTLSFMDMWLVGSYALRLPVLPWLMIGGNAKFRIQRQFDRGVDVSSWPGIDLGIYVNPLDHYRFGDIGLSLNFQDIIPAELEWDDEAGGTAEQEVTTRLRMGLRYALWNDRLVMDVEGVVDNIFIDLLDNMGVVDLEDFNVNDADALAKAFRLSGHIRYQFIPQLWVKLGWNNNKIPYVGLNLNLIYPLPEMINYVSVDCNVGYGFIESLVGEDGGSDERGFTLMVKGSTDFGPTREQRESRRLYDKLILEPMNAYEEAMRLYMEGRYWEAAFAFGKVVSLYPNFHLNDKVAWYTSDCYYRLHLNSIARDVCKEALEEYTTSEQRARYLYGLQRLDYREGKPEDALKNHAFIVNLYPESDVRPEADYLAAQIHFERKNYNVAEQLLTHINPGTPVYLYAQYTLAVVLIETERVDAAIQALTNIVADTTIEQAEQMLQDAANLKLGHIYYEQGDQLRKAVEHYRRVPVGSAFGDEALLATAWAWIKVNQAEQCRQDADRLVTSYPESPLVPEAYLVKGYALMLLRNFREAVAALETCLELCKGTYVTEEELVKRKRANERVIQDFIPTAQEIKKNAMRKPTDRLEQERPALKVEYDKYYKQNEEFFRYVLLAKSHSRFFRRKEQVVEDAEYALARATSMMQTSRGFEATRDAKEKTEKIDTKIEDLKKQLEQLKK